MSDEPLTLSIETALDGGSISLLKGSRLIDSYIGEQKNLRLDNLLQEIKFLFKDSSFQLKDLDLVVVSKGPGSFTGIRVGMAAAQGLAKAVGCKIIGVSVVQALAWGIKVKGRIFVSIPANRNQFFWQTFEKQENDLFVESILGNGEIEDLKAEYIKQLNTAKSTEEKLYVCQFGNTFESKNTIEENLVSYQNASDNVSVNIALLSHYLLKKNPSFNTELQPIYITN